MIERIFLDMDGVTYNFIDAACRAYGRDPAEVRANWPKGHWDIAPVFGTDETSMWEKLGEDPGFWFRVEPHPWALSLYAACCQVAPTCFLTAPPRNPLSACAKMAALQRLFGVGFGDFLIGPVKTFCAGPMNLLIDDNDENCQNFIRAGGKAIVFPRMSNSRHELGDVAFETVYNELQAYREGSD